MKYYAVITVDVELVDGLDLGYQISTEVGLNGLENFGNTATCASCSGRVLLDVPLDNGLWVNVQEEVGHQIVLVL